MAFSATLAALAQSKDGLTCADAGPQTAGTTANTSAMTRIVDFRLFISFPRPGRNSDGNGMGTQAGRDFTKRGTPGNPHTIGPCPFARVADCCVAAKGAFGY
jgi:hypothetical protein